MNNDTVEIQDIHRLWSHLHWLNVLAQQGSYTRAAARLGVSKAAVSQHIADLERHAGIPLVRRTTRNVQLTEAGRRLVEDTEAAFAQIARSYAELRDRSGNVQGLLRITAPVAFARQQLLPSLASFLTAHPALRIQLDLSDRLTSVAGEGFDLSIRHTDAPPDTHVAWPLCHIRSVLVASASYLDRRGRPSRPEDLGGHSCLHYPRGPGTPSWTLERPGPEGGSERISVPVSGVLAVNNSEALRDAALAGLGIALLPDFSAQAALQAGTLCEVLSDWRPVRAFAERIYAIRPYSSQVPRSVSALVEHLRLSLAAGFDAGVPA